MSGIEGKRFKMVAALASEWSVGSLKDLSLCRSNDYPACLLNEDGGRILENILKLMKQNCNKTRATLKQWALSEGPLPPLEMMCRLNEEGLMLVTTYFYLMPHRVNLLYEAFEVVYSNFCADASRRRSAATEVSCVIAQVVNTLMTHDEKMQMFFKAVSDKIVETAVKLIAEEGMHGCYLSDLLNHNYIFQQCLTSFMVLNLQHLLSYPTPEMDPNIVLGHHTKKWSSQTLNTGATLSVAKMLSCLPSEMVISELKAAAENTPVRWRYILTVLFILLTEKPDSASLLKGLIDDWLRAGLEENNKKYLYLALISARHCCAEKTTQFPSYINWFGSSQPTNPAHFVIFFKFLTELVPHEPPLYLKIHVNKVPPAPPGCQAVLTDYISLVKTRLADLNETTDYVSIFNKWHDTEKENQEYDVRQLINHFVATNEIANPVIEASVFRKSYYEKVFLKYLLSTSAQEDQTRAQVIRKLNSMGKIPTSMFNSWQSK